MLELIRHWLVGITCAAMLVALAESLIPAGSIRRIARLTGGLVLLAAILNPRVSCGLWRPARGRVWAPAPTYR